MPRQPQPTPPAGPTYICGLDLGQTTDYTAVAILEKTEPQGQAHYGIRHLERFPLGTSYTAVADQVDALVRRPPLIDCALAVDQTGVGRAVVDLLRAREMPCHLLPITVTAGLKATKEEDGSRHVPKKDLVAAALVLAQARPARLIYSKGLAHAATLAKELESFRIKITAAANETFGAWREGQHDDLVFAVALACWVGQHVFTGAFDVQPDRRARLVDPIPQDAFLPDSIFLDEIGGIEL